MVDQCPSMRRCFQAPSMIAYRRSKNIGKMLIRAKINTNRTSRRTKNGYSACKHLCMACPSAGLHPGERIDTHKCEKTGETWNISCSLNCLSSNVVYRLTCRKPQCKWWVYIGETSQRFCDRLTQHRGYITRKEIDKAA